MIIKRNFMAAVLFAIIPSFTFADEIRCKLDPEIVTFEDAGEGRAILFYYNSGAGCSGGLNEIRTTPNGISVRIVITVNVDENGEKEHVVVYPQTLGMYAYPPEQELKDGESIQIIVSGGTA